MAEPYVVEQQEKIARLRRSFLSGRTLGLEWRKEQLVALRNCLFNCQDKFCEALKQDLHKHRSESMLTEFAMVFEDIELSLNHLKQWMSPSPVAKPSMLVFGMDTLHMRPEPYGVVTIISPWNYPVQLSLVAMVGAIAGGNCIILKPSEVAPATERVMAEELPKYLDPECFQVVCGGIPETTALLRNKFDMIFYTGSTAVGKIVMRAAAEHLTPVVLELGGKSPVVVDRSADLTIAARRVMWGKLINAGQSCIAPDYVLIEEQVERDFIAECIKAAEAFYGAADTSDSYGRIVTERHFDRLVGLLEGTEIVFGGDSKRDEKYIAPTIVRATPDHRIMQEEIFGPILVVVAVKNVKEAVDFINARDKPLACYVFSNDSDNIELVERCTSSGGFVANDTMIHASVNTLPFGGVGPSGIGGYHGKHSFEAFSHMKPCVRKYPKMEFANDVRYAPYTESKLNRILWVLGYPQSPPSESGGSKKQWVLLLGVVGALGLALYLRS